MAQTLSAVCAVGWSDLLLIAGAHRHANREWVGCRGVAAGVAAQRLVAVYRSPQPEAKNTIFTILLLVSTTRPGAVYAHRLESRHALSSQRLCVLGANS
jgi:hypothetical protein